jgi:hypothetical protein
VSIYKPKDRKEAKRSILVLVVVLAVACVALGLLVGALTSGGTGDERTDQVRVVVNYSGSWSGAVGDLDGVEDWGHNGSYSVVLSRGDAAMWIVSANAQKGDDSGMMLRISIETLDGVVLKEDVTMAAYGVAQVAVEIE